MDIALLGDSRLLFIMLLAGVVAMLTTLNIAARPAAVRTKQVALALAVSSVFFMFTRFANLFYLPILASYVDEAVKFSRTDVLYAQIEWVVIGSALGAFMSWVMLPTFTAIYERGIAGVETRGSMLRVMLAVFSPRGIKALFGCLRSPLLLKGWLKDSPEDSSPHSNASDEAPQPPCSKLPKELLIWNIFATAIWSVGALCALQVSAQVPDYAATAVLLSGLVNSFAAIAFSIFVDPKAALITDQAVHGQRNRGDVYKLTFHLGLGNFIGNLLGLAVFPIGIRMIQWATIQIGNAEMAQNMWIVIGLNVLVCCLMCTNLSSRVSAVLTRNVATTLAIYNVFFLITRLTTQIYAPILGAVRDSVVKGTASADNLLPLFRWVIMGATVGNILGLILLATFVEIYNQAIAALEKRGGSMAVLLKDAVKPKHWGTILRCFKAPSFFGVTWADIKELPKSFLVANVVVVGIHIIGVLAAIQAGAYLSGSLARTATLLSSVINGAATIMASLIVDPTAAHITDQAVNGKRTLTNVKAMTVFLALGGVIGSLLSQLLFMPSVELICLGAKILDFIF